MSSDTSAERVGTFERLSDNPEIFRFVRANLRLTNAVLLLGGCFLLLCLVTGIIFMACWDYETRSFSYLSQAMEAFLYFLLVAEFIIFLAGGAFTAATLIAKEKETNTFELYHLTTYSRPWAMFGRIFGGTLLVYLLIQVILPFVIFTAIVGKVPAGPLIKLHILLLMSGLFFHLFAFFLSLLQKKASAAQSLLVVSCVGYGIFSTMAKSQLDLAFMSLLNPLIYSFEIVRNIDSSVPVASTTIPFMNWSLSILTATFLLYIYFGFWFWVISVRKMKSLFASWLSRRQLLGLFLSFNFLLLAFLVPLPSHSSEEVMTIFAIVNLLLLVISAYVVVPDYVEYVDQKESRRKDSYLSSRGPVSFYYLLTAIPVLMLLVTGLVSTFSSVWIKDYLLYSYCIIVYSVLYFYVIRFFRLFPWNSSDVVGGFVIVLSLLLPFPAALTMGWKQSLEFAFVLNPLGLLTKMFHSGQWDYLSSFPVLLNYLVPLLALVAMRFAIAYRERNIELSLNAPEPIQTSQAS